MRLAVTLIDNGEWQQTCSSGRLSIYLNICRGCLKTSLSGTTFTARWRLNDHHLMIKDMLCFVYKHILQKMSRIFITYLYILAINGQMGEVRFDLLLAHVSGVPHVMIADESLYPGQIRPLGFEEVVFSAQHIDDDCKRLLVPGVLVHHRSFSR